MTALEEFKKFKDEHWMTTDHLLFEAQHRGNEAIAEVYRSLERAEDDLAKMTTGAEMALSAHDDLERVLEHEEESNHISIEQWGIWEERAKQTEAKLERARSYRGIEAYACPLCEYKDGVFIRSCEPHRQLHEAEAALAERDQILEEAARTIFTMECAYKGIFDEDEAVPVILADIRAATPR